ncbi:hypothetical protein ACIRD2_33245 [Streptomyces sp. NPDC093595]|uniref:hypothetical protein n=1 Tax=Streptomyces sp. NPDC093595 TaxID=3366045 RepID=UPI0037F82BF8
MGTAHEGRRGKLPHGQDSPCDVPVDPAPCVTFVVDQGGGEGAGVDLGGLGDEGRAGSVVAQLQSSDVVGDVLGVDGVAAAGGAFGKGGVVAEGKQPVRGRCLDSAGPTGIHVVEGGRERRQGHAGRAGQSGLGQVGMRGQELAYVTESRGGIGRAATVATVTVGQIVRHDGQQAGRCRAADCACCVWAALGIG